MTKYTPDKDYTDSRRPDRIETARPDSDDMDYQW